MFNDELLPFNIDLLVLNEENIKLLKPVSDLAIFEPSSRNFSSKGLYSTEIFNNPGTEHRNRTFSYIDLKTTILHPTLFYTLIKLKAFYGEILAGKSYAVFDSETKDFIKSDAINGNTGYQFFVSHFHEISPVTSDSDRRSFSIRLIEKYKNKAALRYFIVMPAGLRDIEIDSDNRPVEDEINLLYRKVIAVSNLIPEGVSKRNPESIDSARYKIQLAVNAVYDYIKAMVEGKKKFILGKWASRNTFNGTRNVITTINSDVDELFSPLTVSSNQTIVGLFQYAKAVQPMALFKLKAFLEPVFPDPNSPAKLINKKTLRQELVYVKPKTYDDWMTNEGLEKLLNKYGIPDTRHEVLSIEGRYLGLIYRDKKQYMLLSDIAELPENMDKNNVQPLTFTELLYLVLYKDSDQFPAFVTRYPVAALGGVYPSYVYLKSTVRSEQLSELDVSGQPTGILAKEFPMREGEFYNSMSPSLVHLGRLGGDYDGDMCSLVCTFTEESKEEVKRVLGTRAYYIDSKGAMMYSAKTDVDELVLAHMTGD